MHQRQSWPSPGICWERSVSPALLHLNATGGKPPQPFTCRILEVETAIRENCAPSLKKTQLSSHLFPPKKGPKRTLGRPTPKSPMPFRPSRGRAGSLVRFPLFGGSRVPAPCEACANWPFLTPFFWGGFPY